MAKTSRKRRKDRQRAARAPVVGGPGSSDAPQPPQAAGAAGAQPPPRTAGTEPASSMEGGYARGRAKEDAARAALKPLAPGERPTAVTVGAVAMGLLALANLIATLLGWDGGTDADEAQRLAGSLLVTALLVVVTYGLWKARYWAVLGLQTLLGIAIILASLGLITAASWWATVLLLLIVAGSGTLFWFMVKAMARIQMPERPGASTRR